VNERDPNPLIHAAPRGWLLLLCGLLGLWQPLSVALVASGLLSRAVDRGAPAILALTARGLAVSIGLAAALALWRGHAAGVHLARVTIVASMAITVVTHATGALPPAGPPGVALPAVAAVLAFDLAWLIYLFRSKQVLSLLGGGTS
jgi:hypothetical protein